MNIEVLFFARLKETFGESSRKLRLNAGASIHEAVRLLGQESEDLLLNKIPLVYAVNEEFAEGDRILQDRDVLAIMTPVSGG